MKALIRKFIPKFFLSIYHFKLALLGAFFYGFPSRKMIVIGVTGTKGKSTTVMLAGKILEEAGFKVGWITSATLKIGGKEWLNPYHMTMPGRFTIQKLLKEMAKQGCQYCLIEVTSEGMVQHRHRFINFKTAVFTNLKPEHIEAHGSFEKYRACKGKLFRATKKIHILNLDDENVEYFSKFQANEKWFYTLKKKWRGEERIFIISGSIISVNQGGLSFKVQDTEFSLNLLGEFNIYNGLAAITIGLSEGVSLDVCKKALEKIKTIAGRMEVIAEKPFKVIVDLAHTPDSFEEVFKAVKNMPHNRIISVFGAAGGGRDKWKRPVLGKIAAENSDVIILTNEDPYSENPLKIIEEIKSGFSQTPNTKSQVPKCEKILDRREAIKKALEMAKENDIVLILGKGTEQLMMIGFKKIPWDDRKVVKEELDKIEKRE